MVSENGSKLRRTTRSSVRLAPPESRPFDSTKNMMRQDQIIFGIIYLYPAILLAIDWHLYPLWTDTVIRASRTPWCIFTAIWIVWNSDWSAFAIAIPMAAGMYFQEEIKAICRKW